MSNTAKGEKQARRSVSPLGEGETLAPREKQVAHEFHYELRIVIITQGRSYLRHSFAMASSM
ncbi:hypothetical protein GTQ43_11830 [Nostoc sp. KVJ3]|uniref:hypothetical protein n=1 Tax=Nostoc sp. KVJ3 TaxID=457945 RepID=UPI0022383112|nr:hypothetical protein [Nostoc sp. KVJ3]MCW5314472.1 hypothetical protein [Nostoc sp. KVJ3]